VSGEDDDVLPVRVSRLQFAHPNCCIATSATWWPALPAADAKRKNQTSGSHSSVVLRHNSQTRSRHRRIPAQARGLNAGDTAMLQRFLTAPNDGLTFDQTLRVVPCNEAPCSEKYEK
jgi:hypothetical protein